MQTGQDLSLGDNNTIPIVPIVDVSPSTLATKGINVAQVGGTTASNVTAGVLDINVKAINNSTPYMVAGSKPFGDNSTRMLVYSLGWPVSSSGQTLKTYASSNAGSAITAAAPVSVYTVTAGKTFYLMGFTASGLAAGINLSNSTDSIDLVSFAPGAATSETISSSMVPIASVPASKAININTNSAGGGTIWWTMWGWEQ